MRERNGQSFGSLFDNICHQIKPVEMLLGQVEIFSSIKLGYGEDLPQPLARLEAEAIEITLSPQPDKNFSFLMQRALQFPIFSCT